MGLGIVQLATRAKSEREHQRRVVLFDSLVDDSQVEVIRALIERRTSWEELRDAQRRGELKGSSVLGAVALERPFAESVRATLPRMGKATTTRDRYEDSLNALIGSVAGSSREALRVKRGITARAHQSEPEPRSPFRVKDLARVDWRALAEQWTKPIADGGAGKSAADWNRLVAAVSRFLSLYLADPDRQPRGNKYHPFRLELMAKIEKLTETERVPDLSVALFLRIVLALPEHIRPCVYTLLLTGMRDRSEYLRCTEASKMPETTSVRVPGKKTKKSAAVVAIDPELWSWIDAGIPAPVGYKALRGHWQRACLAAGAAEMVDSGLTKLVDGEAVPILRYRGLWLHDLRHACAQWAHDAGEPLSRIMSMLRHSNLQMSERYSRTTSTRQVARALGNVLRAAK